MYSYTLQCNEALADIWVILAYICHIADSGEVLYECAELGYRIQYLYGILYVDEYLTAASTDKLFGSVIFWGPNLGYHIHVPLWYLRII